MAIRLSGLTSGMDTEALVTELMKAKSQQKVKVENKKTKLQWTQDKWKSLNTKLYSLYTDQVSKMRMTSAYATKKVSLSDSSIAGVTAKSTAINGSYTLQVNQIATANYVTSDKITAADGSKVTKDTKLSDLTGGSALSGREIHIAYKGKSTDIEVNEDMTVGMFVDRLKSVGLSASFDEVQQRIFASSNGTGEANNFSITVGGSAEINARDTVRNLFGYNTDTLSVEDKDEINAMLAKVKDNAAGSKEYEDAITALKAKRTSLNLLTTDGDIETAVATYKEAVNNHAADNSLAALGLTDIVSGVAQGNKPSGMAVITGTDSEIVLNGATLRGSETTVTANGLTFELKGLTNGSQVSFSVSNDTKAVYDSIKNFISEYNSVLEEMNTAYHAAAVKGYEPLTDEQKESMTDEQIVLWEDKIKGSLLRRDDTLGGIINSMKSAMMSSVEIDGKNYSLSSLGIMTKDYTEYGKLHIYGDTDDTAYADKEDKLNKLLEEDPEFVSKLMTGVTQKLYDTMQKKMGTSTLSSALTFYNDKQMKKQMTSYESSLTEWEKKLKTLEDRYYKQFTAMEKAMTKMQSEQSNFASMLGTGM